MSQVRLDFMGRVSPVEEKVYEAMKGQVEQFLPKWKEPEGSCGLAELEEILAVTSKSQRLSEHLKATTGKC